MGRKIEIKRIESRRTCQVTYAKRKNSLMKKAQEISIACGVDIAVITFSPFKDGRSTKYCNRERIEDLIQRYLNLSTEKRFHEVPNYKRHVRCTCHSAEKLKQLDHIKDGDESKLKYLKKQIKDIELRIREKSHEVEILNDNLKVYEPESAEDILPSQLVWLERKLKIALQQVQYRKKELIGTPSRKYKKFGFPKNQMENERKDCNQFSYISSLLPMQNGPLITEYRSLGLPKGSFQELLTQGGGTSFGNYTQNLPIPEAQANIPSNSYSSLASEINQIPPIQSNSGIQGLGLPAIGIQSYPITETLDHNWDNMNNNKSILFPPTSHGFEGIPNDENNNFNAQNSDFNYIETYLPLNSESNNNDNDDNDHNNGCNEIENNRDFDEIFNLIDDNNNNNRSNNNIRNNENCDERFNLTDANLKSIIMAVADNNNNNNSNNDNNGGCEAASSQENPWPNLDEAEKGDGLTTSTIEGNKDDIDLWELDNLKWAKDLSLEDLQNLLDEL